MNLSAISSAIRRLPSYRVTLGRLTQDAELPGLGLPRSARAPIAAALAKDLAAPVVILVSRADRWLTWTEELGAWLPEAEVLPFPEPNPLFYEPAAWGPRTIRQRIQALAALADPSLGSAPPGRLPIVIATARAAMTRTLPREDFDQATTRIASRGHVDLASVARQLIGLGYHSSAMVLEPGQMSRRGGILDVWPPASPRPARLEFEGDTVETLRSFDPESQRSVESQAAVTVTPAREAPPGRWDPAWGGNPAPSDEELARIEFYLPWMTSSTSGLLDYLPPSSWVFFDDRSGWEETVLEMEEQASSFRKDQRAAQAIPEDFPVPFVSLSEIQESLDPLRTLDLASVDDSIDEDSLGALFSPGPRFAGQLPALLDHLSKRQREHDPVVVVSRQADRLRELWEEDAPGVAPERETDELGPGEVRILSGALTEGWQLELEGGSQLQLLTDAEIFGWVKPRPRPRRSVTGTAPETAYADLKAGDWVVHVDHGIARFAGLVARSLDGLPREFLQLLYAEGDELFVPIHQADRVMRYLGSDGVAPTSSRLGSADWERAKVRAQGAVEEVARELLALYARRLAVAGYAFGPDGAWLHELEASFPFEETEDQLLALEAIKRDMQSPRPMDRLICGDAGYGKTEVALRAAFKAVLDGKQVAVLVPTTVLAQQHHRTFRQRLAPFPVEIEVLSRFRTRPETEMVLERLARGDVDMVIGTHRLLQRDVRFHDLGLVIIDEEQRFGVAHKEALKRMRTEVDVLTLTATPIPRTLYMALTGVRDISTINTPPEQRVSVVTHVGAYDPHLVRQAVLRELERDGQIFYVHNRVQTIDAAVQRLARLVPEAKLGVAHGQMPEDELAGVMDQFSSGEIDVLISTSIIESGLDIPNSNTLIVEQADHFGLAQLHQLRGRVGRSASRGYAYFFRHARFRSSAEGLERLETLAEHSQLGAGYTLAMRDLEMRGAGDILGNRQHGHISAVGFHLYTRLLAQAVQRLKDQEWPDLAPPPLDWWQSLPGAAVTVELPLPSAIPEAYIADRDLRLQIYRRLADLKSETDLASFEAELGDRFGPAPDEVENLVYQLRVKILATEARVEAITSENGQILIRLTEARSEAEVELGKDVRWSKRGIWLGRGGRPGWRDRLLDILRELAPREVAAEVTARAGLRS